MSLPETDEEDESSSSSEFSQGDLVEWMEVWSRRVGRAGEVDDGGSRRATPRMGNERRTGEPGHRSGRSGDSTGDSARGEALVGTSASPKSPSVGRSAAPIEALRVRAAVPRWAAGDVGSDTRRPLTPIGPAMRAYPKNSPLWFALKIKYTPSELDRYAWSRTGSL